MSLSYEDVLGFRVINSIETAYPEEADHALELGVSAA
jgi:hypothetical protein